MSATRSILWRGRRPPRSQPHDPPGSHESRPRDGGELVEKTGIGNLFMVVGEPDIDVRPAGDDQIALEVRGFYVCDPTTGVLRSSSVDDIAAWFLDTNYDGDAFFVRPACFTGADDPCDKLRRALRADISEILTRL